MALYFLDWCHSRSTSAENEIRFPDGPIHAAKVRSISAHNSSCDGIGDHLPFHQSYLRMSMGIIDDNVPSHQPAAQHPCDEAIVRLVSQVQDKGWAGEEPPLLSLMSWI